MTDVLTAAQAWSTSSASPTCEDEISPPELCEPPPGAHQRFLLSADVFPLIYGEPLSASRFDRFPRVSIRTVGFGAVPVEASISMELPSASDGLPVGLRATAAQDFYKFGQGPCTTCSSQYSVIGDSSFSGAVNLRIVSLQIDGKPIDVGRSCRAVGARISGVGKGYINSAEVSPIDPETGMPPGAYNPRIGGLISGTVDVPPFRDCGARERLDPLINTVASGKGFPIRIEQAPIDGECIDDNPESVVQGACKLVGELPLPHG